MFVLSFNEIQILNLNESDYDCNNHHGVDDGIIGVDDHDGNELIIGLADEGEVEDEGDCESDEGEQPHEQTNVGVRPVQRSMS